MSTIWIFDNVENMHSLYRGEDFIKKFCISLKEHEVNVINFEKKKMLLLTDKELKFHEHSTVCYIWRKNIHKSLLRIKIIVKLEPFVTAQVDIKVQHIVFVMFNVLNEIPVVFHNGSSHDYHFIIKELANEFKGQAERLG